MLILPYSIRFSGRPLAVKVGGASEPWSKTEKKLAVFAAEARSLFENSRKSTFKVTVRQTTGAGNINKRQLVATIIIKARADCPWRQHTPAWPDWMPECLWQEWHAVWRHYWSNRLAYILGAVLRSAEATGTGFEIPASKEIVWHESTEAELEFYAPQALADFEAVVATGDLSYGPLAKKFADHAVQIAKHVNLQSNMEAARRAPPPADPVLSLGRKNS